MSAELIILVLLIATALAFDFTNGFHDTGNAMATSIATGALKPKVEWGLEQGWDRDRIRESTRRRFKRRVKFDET